MLLGKGQWAGFKRLLPVWLAVSLGNPGEQPGHEKHRKHEHTSLCCAVTNAPYHRGSAGSLLLPTTMGTSNFGLFCFCCRVKHKYFLSFGGQQSISFYFWVIKVILISNSPRFISTTYAEMLTAAASCALQEKECLLWDQWGWPLPTNRCCLCCWAPKPLGRIVVYF